MEFGGETFYKALLNDMTTFVGVLDIEGNVIFVNNTPLIAAGLTLGDVKGKKFWDAPWWQYSKETIENIRSDVLSCAEGKPILHEVQMQVGDGSLIWIEYSMHPIFGENGAVEYLVPEGRNIDDKKKQENILRHTQKMDAIGKLTAGIAHDYNNMLGIISGYVELLSVPLQGDTKLSNYLKNIKHAAQRSHSLTQKLLSFSKVKVQKTSLCNLNDILKEEQLLLEKTLTNSIQISFNFDKSPYLTELDSNDFKNVVLNLCINAVHAMPNGGKLSITTKNKVLKGKEYICLSVIDTGTGMNEDILSKIFDPFFTTKGDEGTGLGLSQVFGFIHSSNALIEVESTLGKGTSIIMHFLKSESVSADITNNDSVKTKQKTILVVDDEESLTELAKEILTDKGYKVLTTYSASQALEILPRESIDLVLTDVRMPNMTGYELATLVHQHYPNIKIQMVSGFEGDGFDGDDFKASLHQNIITKPYQVKTLIAHIEEHFE